MQAAATAARRGHSVVLFERDTRLGGMLRRAADLPEREELRAFPDWLEAELGRTGVEVVLDHEPTGEELAGFDDVVLATGAARPEPDTTRWPLATTPFIGLEAALTAPLPGTNVLIVDRGDHHNIALLLARRLVGEGATQVTLLDTDGPVAATLDALNRLWLTRDLGRDERVRLVSDVTAIRIEGRCASFDHGGRTQAVDDVDLVVVLEPPIVRPIATDGLDGHRSMVLVGDCGAPGHAVEAVAHAHAVAGGI